MIDKFHQISINGRYIYCYLCLRKTVESRSLPDIPKVLDFILKDFTNSSRLDVWQDSANEVLPSWILDQEKNADNYKAISYEHALVLRRYYSESQLLTDVIENLIWLGMSNLYGRFDSKITFEYVKDIIELMTANNIQLPEFSVVSSHSVDENRGWGNPVNMGDLLL
ncbi:hypothetical protein D0C36_06300 [Mucilaginibacter conchicola]|uniref:Uncharacterized protein n=1 Tax=Mucilaginibacter conchicola TaxID=2303333 RepID=A0A372NYF5_9SPHI|nr:hypothetical protein [Mucilaginibacter conchicola]RFZ95135.1 hypothetical protein D0C36_06300 [Mucilaginibacter conchicola]